MSKSNTAGPIAVPPTSSSLQPTQWDPAHLSSALQAFYTTQLANVIPPVSDHDQALLEGVTIHLHPGFRGRESGMPQILHATAYRLLVQSKCLATFLLLVRQGLITTRGLKKPLELVNMQSNRGGILDALNALAALGFVDKVVSETVETEEGFDALGMFGGYTVPLTWLATMIVRGARPEGSDAWFLIRRIAESGILGALDETMMPSWWPDSEGGETRIAVDADAGWYEGRRGKNGDAMCFLLPHALEAVPSMDELERLNETFERELGAFRGLYRRFFEWEGSGVKEALLE